MATRDLFPLCELRVNIFEQSDFSAYTEELWLIWAYNGSK